MDNIYYLNNLLEAAHLLNGLSSEWNRRQLYGPTDSLLEYKGEGQNFLLKDLVYNNREFSNQYFRLRV